MVLSRAARRAAILVEVMGIFLGGIVIGRAVGRSLGLRSIKDHLATLPPGTIPDLFALGWNVAAEHFIRYGILLTLAFLSASWIAQHSRSDYGFSRGGRRWSDLLLDGVAAFAVFDIPAEAIQVVSAVWFPAGRTASWQLIDRVPWDWRFWFFMAVSSYLIVPIVEELTFRGWMQTRLADGFGKEIGIALTAIVFALSHTQYIRGNAIAFLLLIGTLFGALLFGVLREQTASLVPPIVAHALVNVPTRGTASAVMLVLILPLLVLLLRRRVALLLRNALTVLRAIRWGRLAWPALLFVVIAAAVIVIREPAAMAIAALGIFSVIVQRFAYNARRDF